jgi:hypothetical protein
LMEASSDCCREAGAGAKFHVPVRHEAPRHEGVWGEYSLSPTGVWPVSRPGHITSGTNPFDRKLGWPQSRSRHGLLPSSPYRIVVLTELSQPLSF